MSPASTTFEPPPGSCVSSSVFLPARDRPWYTALAGVHPTPAQAHSLTGGAARHRHMRVALFTNTYQPNLNGVANVTHFYRRGLAERGHEVHVFTPTPLGDDPFADDPFVHCYRSVLAPGEVDYMIALPVFSSLREHRYLRTLQADIVHSQHPLWVGAWGHRWARRRKLPFVSTAHTQYELHADRSPLFEAWVQRLIIRHVTRFFNLCDVATTPVNWMRRLLLDRGVTTPIEILRNPVDLAQLAEPDREGTRRRLGLDADDTVIGYLGRLSPIKNLECVIDAVELMSRRRRDLRLLVVGDGPIRKTLQQHAERKLGAQALFTGAVPHAEVAHYDAAMDVFVTASRSETMPLAYTEAMYCGTPVVAHATPGAADMIRDGDTGLLVPPERGAEGLVEAIERVLSDPALRRRLLKGGRRFAESCAYPAIAERLEEIYALAAERAREGGLPA